MCEIYTGWSKMRRLKRVIQLNADLELLTVVPMKKAISKVMTNKARIVEQDETRPIIHPLLDFRPPLIIALKEYVYVPFIKAKITRKNVLIRDKYICQYCGIKLGKGNRATIDHVIPKSRSNCPGNTWENLVACCQKCNNKKDNKTPSEADMKLARKPEKPQSEDLLIGDRVLREKYKKLKGR